MNFTEQIKKAIEQTALNRNDEGIVTAEDMIPRMDHEKYQNKLLDIPYGDKTGKEKLDIYYPETGDDPFPVFIEVHGGGWYFGQKNSVEFEPFLAGLERGFACVSLGYTLSPEAHYPLAVLEIKAAIRFLRKNAEKYNLDPGRFALTWPALPQQAVIPGIWRRICLAMMRTAPNPMPWSCGTDALITITMERWKATGCTRISSAVKT